MNYYGTDYDDNSLAHYGVLGMKWGVRKANRLRTKGSKYSQKAANAKTAAKKDKYTKKSKKAYKKANWLEEDMAIDQDYKKLKKDVKKTHKRMNATAESKFERQFSNNLYRTMNNFNKDHKYIRQVANDPKKAKRSNYIKGNAKAIAIGGLFGPVSPVTTQAIRDVNRKTALANKVIDSKNKGYDVSKPQVMKTDTDGHIKDITYNKKKKKG